jgi:hypothetical protein
MAIINTQVQSIAVSIFLADAQYAVTTMVFCNVTTVTNTLSVYAVPAGENPGPTTQLVNEVILPGGESFSFDSERFVLDNGDAFYAQCTNDNAITAIISAVATA